MSIKRNYRFSFILNRWLIIGLFTLLFGEIGYIYSAYIQKPLYTSNASLVIYGESQSSDNKQKMINNYISLINTRKVIESALSSNNYSLKYNDVVENLRVSSNSNSDIINISFDCENSTCSQKFVSSLIGSYSDTLALFYKDSELKVIDNASYSREPANINTMFSSVSFATVGMIISIILALLAYEIEIAKNYVTKRQEHTVSIYQSIAKPAFDYIFATIFTVLIAIPMLFVAILIKIDSKGPVIFKQLRSGRGRREFYVYKFRTMSIDAPKNIPTNDFKDAKKYITRLGKIMRKLSIDELPQIINVLRGEMSIVGPRPIILNETELLDLREKYGANSVKPGLTGWAQVNGRDEVNIYEKARMDGEYSNNLTMKTDIKCLILTIWAVLSLNGQKEGHEQAPIPSGAPEGQILLTYYFS